MNLNMISNYVKAKWSKGVGGKKVDVTTKDIRLLSCFGNGDDISVCPALRPSEQKMGKFLCGECGCGDKQSVWLNGDEHEYTKLDHPYLSCPRKMPGFSDYEPAVENSEDFQEQRKKVIELTLGTKVLKMKKLVKPEMSKRELAELKEKQAEMQRQQAANNENCPSCKDKAKIRDEIIERLRQEEGLEPDFKNPDYQTKFRKIWFADERVIKANEEIKKQQTSQGKQGCASCGRKKEIRDEVMREFENSGLEGTELMKAVTKVVQERLRKESEEKKISSA